VEDTVVEDTVVEDTVVEDTVVEDTVVEDTVVEDDFYFDSDHFSSLDDLVNEGNKYMTMFTPHRPKMALMIGINYIMNDEPFDNLNGCVNDIQNTERFLKSNCDFQNENITKLINDGASKQNIMDNLNKLVSYSHTIDNCELWLSYSGHGGGQFSINEEDNQCEFICPSDYLTNGVIYDTWLYENFIQKLSTSAKCFILMDCCNSKTNMNLPYSYSYNKSHVDVTLAKIIKISGCNDSQTSADYYDSESNSYQGALTNSFLKRFEYYNKETIATNFIYTRDNLKNRNFTQVPELTCSDTNLLEFSLY
jgi:hypothetical protein